MPRGRSVPVRGVVKPDLDDRALKRETRKLERSFGGAMRSATDIASRRLQRGLEDAIPGGRTLGSIVDSRRSGGRRSGIPRRTGSGDLVELAKIRNDLLRSQINATEKGDVSAAKRGGGGAVAGIAGRNPVAMSAVIAGAVAHFGSQWISEQINQTFDVPDWLNEPFGTKPEWVDDLTGWQPDAPPWLRTLLGWEPDPIEGTVTVDTSRRGGGEGSFASKMGVPGARVTSTFSTDESMSGGGEGSFASKMGPPQLIPGTGITQREFDRRTTFSPGVNQARQRQQGGSANISTNIEILGGLSDEQVRRIVERKNQELKRELDQLFSGNGIR